MVYKESPSVATILEKFPQLFSGFLGDTNTKITNITAPEQAKAGHLVFVLDPKYQSQALASGASAIVINNKLKETIEAMGASHLAGKTFLFSKNQKLALALIKTEYFGYEIPIQKAGTIHPTAVIDPSAKIGKNVSIGAHTVIGQNVVIGDDVRIDASVVIEADVHIKKGSHLNSLLYIGPRTEIGEYCELMAQSSIGAEGFGLAHDEKGHFYRIPQTGKVVLEDRVEIGSMCTIDRATFGVTRIGEGTKIDKNCHIAHNCDIGKHCAIAGKFSVAGSTRIGDHFVCGGRVTVNTGITITDGVELAGVSGVHGNITVPGKYGGHPLQSLREYMKTINTTVHLPRMRKQISKILKHLGLGDET